MFAQMRNKQKMKRKTQIVRMSVNNALTCILAMCIKQLAMKMCLFDVQVGSSLALAVCAHGPSLLIINSTECFIGWHKMFGVPLRFFPSWLCPFRLLWLWKYGAYLLELTFRKFLLTFSWPHPQQLCKIGSILVERRPLLGNNVYWKPKCVCEHSANCSLAGYR